MCKLIGNIENMYNFVLEHQDDVKKVIINKLDVEYNDIKIELRRSDLAIRIIVDSEKIITTYETKILFTIDRLNEYTLHPEIDILNDILMIIKLDNRKNKIKKLKNARKSRNSAN